MTKTPVVLTIAGSDPYGGAGIQVDAKTIHALGGYALSVPTALTSQNSQGVRELFAPPVAVLESQLCALLDDMQVDAVKIGMLANAEIVVSVAKLIERYSLKNVVLDTVLVSSSGKDLLATDALEVLKAELFPRADVITPNLPELNRLLNTNYQGIAEEMDEIGEQLWRMNVKAAVIKGGHSATDSCTDYVLQPASKPEALFAARVQTSHTHGTGCILSSAIAIGLAQGLSMQQAVVTAKTFLTDRLTKAEKQLALRYLEAVENRRTAII